MNVVFIGTALPNKELNAYIKDNMIYDIPAYTMGWNIISGLEENNVCVKVINDLKISHSKRKKIIINDENLGNIEYIQTERKNLKYFNKISKLIWINKTLKKVNVEEIDAIIVYSLHTPYLIPALFYSKKNKIPLITVVPDLPQYMSDNKNIIYKSLKKIDNVIIKKIEKHISGFIILTKQMENEINNKSSRFLVIEGISNYNSSSIPIVKNKIKYILYTGAIEKRYGLEKLVKEFIKSDVDGELWLCGNGNYVCELKKIENNNSKIKYLGVLDKEKIKKLQEEAYLLVNPRSKCEEYTKYSFPSKTMEYLASGTPVMMERLSGIPNEYYNYIIDAEDDWANSMKKYYNAKEDEIKKIGETGKKFIIEKKNKKTQGQKIKKLIEEISYESKKNRK